MDTSPNMSGLFDKDRGDSDESMPYFSDLGFPPKPKSPDQPDAFVFSRGNPSLLYPRRLPMLTPMWHFSDLTYNTSDDEGSTEEGEDRPTADEGAMDLLINRVILSSIMNKEDEGSFGIENPADGKVEDMDFRSRPRPPMPTTDKQEWKKKTKGNRRPRKNAEGKKDKMPTPEVVGPYGLHLPLHTVRGTNKEGQETITMPLEIYKDTVLAEVDSIARRVYLYFSEEVKCFDEVRLNAMKDSFFWHEKTKILERILDAKTAQITTLEEDIKLLQSKIEGDRLIKQKRRTEKKLRKRAEKESALNQGDETQQSQQNDSLKTSTCDDFKT